MAIRIGTTLKFPAQVEATDGVVVTRENGTFTFALDPDLADLFGFAMLEGGNAFTGVQMMTTGSNSSGLNVLSGSASLNSNINVGRTTTDVQLGVAGFSDQFFTGTAQGDVSLRAASGTLRLGVGSNVSVSISASGVPTLTTPVLGVATATSINGLTITASTGTLTIASGKTLTISNSLTLAGTDSTIMTFPSVSASIPGLAVAVVAYLTKTHG